MGPCFFVFVCFFLCFLVFFAVFGLFFVGSHRFRSVFFLGTVVDGCFS